MRFFPAEPDISTIFNRIVDKDIDLQPDFQRGEVWPVTKQQRLVDTILRGWVVPPILLIAQTHGAKQQVLDGQQRLAAIRDFKSNKFRIDGKIKPHSNEISMLHGMMFDDLPEQTRKKFDRTTLRVYEVADYSPEEPAEIFFRLNQPTALTSAEKRNAFFGPVRDQIRDIVDIFESAIESHSALGFSNSRMAYDDVFARVACTLEYGTLQKKITATGVNEMYRRNEPLSPRIHKKILLRARFLAKSLSIATRGDYAHQIKLNKATLYSWMLFLCRADKAPDRDLTSKFIVDFETSRQFNQSASHRPIPGRERPTESSRHINEILSIYSDRATSRVSDVSSVLARDFAIWAFWTHLGLSTVSENKFDDLAQVEQLLNENGIRDEWSILSFISRSDWGSCI
ncbi:DUF262 domain-containing protein [Stenotrophomonas sp. NRRL B-14846]|uniref:DUF262 domain-containing protein n=1 Tax=Stenotrophomonas sp. NRRL B-14846 TaxID=3162882 RepID=UPI003D2C6122